jgi:hypothetical protein
MTFDFIVGNPPYGRKANLVLKFLNRCVSLSKDIRMVLPKTVRKESFLARLDRRLHLVSDTNNKDFVFGPKITTCNQRWIVKEELRLITKSRRNHSDFEFVTKEESNLFICRVGGVAGKVMVKDYDHYYHEHYFLKVKSDAVIQRLISLESTFRAFAKNTVGIPSLSKSDLIRIYEESLK